MKRVAALFTIVTLSGCFLEEQRVDPEDFNRACRADSRCVVTAFVRCSSACGDMAIVEDEVERARAELAGECGEAWKLTTCRTDAYDARCVDGACELVDFDGNALGAYVEGQGDNPPPD